MFHLGQGRRDQKRQYYFFKIKRQIMNMMESVIVTMLLITSHF